MMVAEMAGMAASDLRRLGPFALVINVITPPCGALLHARRSNAVAMGYLKLAIRVDRPKT
jgi:hypothetical protein